MVVSTICSHLRRDASVCSVFVRPSVSPDAEINHRVPNRRLAVKQAWTMNMLALHYKPSAEWICLWCVIVVAYFGSLPLCRCDKNVFRTPFERATIWAGSIHCNGRPSVWLSLSSKRIRSIRVARPHQSIPYQLHADEITDNGLKLRAFRTPTPFTHILALQAHALMVSGGMHLRAVV